MANRVSLEYWNHAYGDVMPQIALKSDPVRAWIESNIPKADGTNKKCIEIGCYPGRYLSVFGELGYELFGIDMTDKLEILPVWLNEQHYKVGSLIKMDFLDFKPKQKFDVVSSFGFIEHFTDWDNILMKHINMVKEGGYLIVEVPNFYGAFQNWVHFTFDRSNYERHCILAMDIEKWKQIIEDNKFEIIYAKYFGKFNFWAMDADLTLKEKFFLKIFKKFRRPLSILLPNDRKIYSPYCGLIARKN